jgi:hypothetical protein
MQSVGKTCLPSRSVTATVMSKTYRRTGDNRALSTQFGAPVAAKTARPTIPTLRASPLARFAATALSRTTRDIAPPLLRLFYST